VTKRTIDGALGILKACKNSKTVERVVYISSASTFGCMVVLMALHCCWWWVGGDEGERWWWVGSDNKI